MLGVSVVDGDAFCRYTYAGDVNLDVIADENDWNIVNNNQGDNGTWERGDLGYDGYVSQNDYNIVTDGLWSDTNALPAAVEGQPYTIDLASTVYDDTQNWG